MAKPPAGGLARSRYHFSRIAKLLERPSIKARVKEQQRLWERSNQALKGNKYYWTTGRDLHDYNDLFTEKGLVPMGLVGPDGNLLDALGRIPRGEGPLRIHEYGAGKGVALGQVSRLLWQPVDTTAIEVFPHPELLKRQRSGEITHIVPVRAEEFMPDKEAHAIFDVAGALTYVEPMLRKDHFLKTAHSLAPGGIMMVGFNARPDKPATVSPILVRGITGGLTGRTHRMPASPRESLVAEMKTVKGYLEGQGFNAHFFPTGFGGIRVPHWGLIVHKPEK
jgi:hypothetical protein